MLLNLYEEQDFGASSGQLGCPARGPARNTEDVQGLTATLGIEPVAESRWTNESGDMAINEQREFSCQ